MSNDVRTDEYEIHLRELQNRVAAIRHPYATEDRLFGSVLELNAVVLGLEQATNAILQAAENIDANIEAVRNGDENAVEEIANNVIEIFSNCNFQDLSGQRINKVLTWMTYVEQRLTELLNLFEPESFSDVPLPKPMSTDAVTDESGALSGPRMEGEGASQADIDNLFP